MNTVFNIGDKVRLIQGSPVMEIFMGATSSSDHYICIWNDNGERCTRYVTELEIVKV